MPALRAKPQSPFAANEMTVTTCVHSLAGSSLGGDAIRRLPVHGLRILLRSASSLSLGALGLGRICFLLWELTPPPCQQTPKHLSNIVVRVKKCERASTLALGVKDASSSTRSDTAHVCLPLSNGKTGPTASQPFAAPAPRQHRAQAQTKEFAAGAN